VSSSFYLRHGADAQLDDGDVAVGVDADVAGDLERLANDARRIELRVFLERARRGERVAAATADRDDLVIGLDDVAVATDQEEVARIRNGEQRLETAQEPIRAPVLGQLDGGARQVARIALELLLELLEERERVGNRPGEAGQDLAVAQLPDLHGTGLHDGLTDRDLAVTAERDAAAVPNGDDGGGVERRVVALQERLLVRARPADRAML
jgi:hypothetical protein